VKRTSYEALIVLPVPASRHFLPFRSKYSLQLPDSEYSQCDNS